MLAAASGVAAGCAQIAGYDGYRFDRHEKVNADANAGTGGMAAGTGGSNTGGIDADVGSGGFSGTGGADTGGMAGADSGSTGASGICDSGLCTLVAECDTCLGTYCCAQFEDC